jgi:hypothetical protein
VVKELLIGGALGGLGLLLYKRWKDAKAAAEKKPPELSDCEKAAQATAAVNPAYGAAALLACKAVKVIEGLNSSVDKNDKEVASRDAKNLQLNGDVEIPQQQGLQGSVLRFKNGCVPYAGAPGFGKCAPGTQSMWMHDTHTAIDAYDYTQPAFRNPSDRDAWLHGGWDKLSSAERGVQVGGVRVHAAALLTGSTDPTAPDPATSGSAVAGAGWTGYVKGRPVTCPAGQAPALWDANGKPIRDQRDGTPPCAPDGVSSFTPSSSPPPPSVGGGTAPVSSTPTCDGANAPAGYTYAQTSTGAWYLRRLADGETPNAGPCAAADPKNAPKALAVTNGRLADMQ